MGADKVLKKMKEVTDDPIGAIKKYKDSEKKPVFGYFCTYTPQEIIHAGGVIPFRILGEKKKVESADSHLQSYSCSLVRTGLDMALLGKLDFLDGTVFPHTCDSIQRLSDIWRINTSFRFHGDVVLPVKLHTDSARTYMIEELSRFKRNFEGYLNKKISNESLWSSIKLYNKLRENLRRLYSIESDAPGIVGAKSVNDCVLAAMFMPPEEHIKLTDELLGDLDGKGGDSDKARVIFSGNLCVFPEIYDFVGNAGGVVVGDDMCTGSRYFKMVVDENGGDPVEAIADGLINRPICAAKHSEKFDRGAYLNNIVKENRADGVIFLLLKFCDPHSFDYPYLKESLEKIDVPHILIETEMDNPSMEQVKTRVEAFIEMISQKK